MNLQNLFTYHIQVEGQVEEKALHAAGPLRAGVVCADAGATRLRICADQSGLIGMLRFLHQQGYVLLSMERGEPLP